MSAQFGTVFLSHADADRQAADACAAWLSSAFLGFVRVEWSSRFQQGSLWWDGIMTAVRDCKLGLVLVTENSLPRPWVNYEVGALAALGKPIIPICLGSVSLQALPDLLGRWQACSYGSASDRAALLRRICEATDLPKQFADEVVRGADGAPVITVASRHARQVPGPVLGHPLARLFPLSDRWTTVIYTCRGTFTHEPCPAAATGVGMKHVVSTHLPVDELRTVSLAASVLVPQGVRRDEDDVIHTLLCSQQAEAMLEGRALTPEGVPPLIDRDWIVVGENNISNLLLHLVEAQLPWRRGIEFVAPHPIKPLRARVGVTLATSALDEQAPGQVRDVSEGGAMVSVFPSPLNLNKRVLSLFGCHRAGQFTLENWLGGAQATSVAEAVSSQREGDYSRTALQIVVDGDRRFLHDYGADLGASGRAVANTTAGGRLFWTRQLGPAISDAVEANPQCSAQDSMYDLSVVIRIEGSEADVLRNAVIEEMRGDYLYWEQDECELGLHITLFEFMTHDLPGADVVNQGQRIARSLGESLVRLSPALKPMPSATRVRGVEIAKGALISYVDFVSDNRTELSWLASVRVWCERAVAEIADAVVAMPLLNRLRVPFPPHVTICRIAKLPDAAVTEALRRHCNRTRNVTLLRQLRASSIELVEAHRRPYRETKTLATIPLPKATQNA